MFLTLFCGLNLIQGLGQIRNQIVHVFGSYGQAYRALEDALVREFGLRKLGVRGGGGMDHEGFDIGHVGQQGEDFQGVDEFEGFCLASLNLEGKDGAASVGEIPLIQGVVGMAGQGRMVHLGHLGVLGEEVHHLEGILYVALYAQGQRFQPLQEDEAAHRGKGGADVPQEGGTGPYNVGGEAAGIGKDYPVITGFGLGELRELAGSLPVKLSAVHDDAANSGAVAAYELGGRMHYYIGPVLDGTEEERRGKRIVDDQGNLVGVGYGRDGIHVNDVSVGIAEGLDEQGLGLRTDGLLKIGDVFRIHESGGNAVGHERVLQQVESAAIDGLGCHNMVSRTGDVQDGISDGGSTGSHGQGTYTSFQGGNAAFQHVLRGIGQAAVDIAGIDQAETGRCVSRVMEYIGRGLVNGDGTGVGSGIGLFLAYVELEGLEVKLSVAHICSFVDFCLQSYIPQNYQTRNLKK